MLTHENAIPNLLYDKLLVAWKYEFNELFIHLIIYVLISGGSYQINALIY